ncbi:histidinol dehydrogenase [Psychrilyobacter sp. S5]|uniref:Histidinol dehydrogenase n=1 Tax=Psychrilyobacter piezotolerans TaxID=2293438 RepID=A0ABX9KEA3_9FUSO|nr:MULTISPECIES: histidinol dehydrogenase [Psychrilyobacter]MCS5422004.1 histidinol dehydrogenase [Psychrilyobacter sp. S5]NDI78936.1 histidinol dehydrogenase [Psychrilyobacter piezotolerans]RDE59327.1 histidinol dehydrogenase [Psychrilyobacter sp. S5]REI39857.1 histidinol dehydrogenase [Psychrilyobacter piezotolerans]
MKILRSSQYDAIKSEILSRGDLDYKDINVTVEEIVKNVKENGDSAVLEYTAKFDGAELERMEVTAEEMERAWERTPESLKIALAEAAHSIRRFHERQKRNSFMDNTTKGKITGQLINPIEKVGIYVPGGKSPYPSTVLMNAIPAKVAGVEDLVMITPPGKTGEIMDNILAAAKIAGVDRIFKVGGAQGIAALAYGTQTIPKVYKITGPGNIYVALAKKQVYGIVDIDMIAGPSEILIIADDSANPRYIAADLLSQAEHDELASSLLITPSEKLAETVSKEVDIQLAELTKKEIAAKSLENYGRIIITEDLDEAIDLANDIAAEHLELMVAEPFLYVNSIKNAGAVFVGENTPEPLGDYYAGPNHTLPTNGTAKFSSPLSVDDFIKKTSVIYYSKEALKEVKDTILEISESEGLTAHSNSIRIRFEEEKL